MFDGFHYNSVFHLPVIIVRFLFVKISVYSIRAPRTRASSLEARKSSTRPLLKCHLRVISIFPIFIICAGTVSVYARVGGTKYSCRQCVRPKCARALKNHSFTSTCCLSVTGPCWDNIHSSPKEPRNFDFRVLLTTPNLERRARSGIFRGKGGKCLRVGVVEWGEPTSAATMMAEGCSIV